MTPFTDRIKRRIYNEIIELRKIRPSVHFEIINNEIRIVADHIKVKLLDNYPFTAPLVTVRNIPYLYTLHTPSHRVSYLINYLMKKPICLCCESIIGHTKQWVPVLTLTDVFMEIEKWNCIKRKVSAHLVLPEIVNAFQLPDDLFRVIYMFLFDE
jgi:hypothetical protein